MKTKTDPFVYCQGCRKDHTIDNIDCIEVLPYNERIDQLLYWCDKADDAYISCIFNAPKV